MKNPTCKKSQEEIIGFVLIILLVTVIAIVFLAISLRKEVERLPSDEIESFLQASMRYSTECFISPERRYNLKDVIVSCAETNERCMNNQTACVNLNETMGFLLRQSWAPCPDCPANSYNFHVFDEDNRTLASLKGGNCSGTRTYSQVFLPSYSGKITSELEICG